MKWILCLLVKRCVYGSTWRKRFPCEFLTFEGRNLDISDTYSSLFLILRRISTSYLCHYGSYVWEVGQAIESETYLRTYICQKV